MFACDYTEFSSLQLKNKKIIENCWLLRLATAIPQIICKSGTKVSDESVALCLFLHIFHHFTLMLAGNSNFSIYRALFFLYKNYWNYRDGSSILCISDVYFCLLSLIHHILLCFHAAILLQIDCKWQNKKHILKMLENLTRIVRQAISIVFRRFVFSFYISAALKASTWSAAKPPRTTYIFIPLICNSITIAIKSCVMKNFSTIIYGNFFFRIDRNGMEWKRNTHRLRASFV